MFKLRFFNDEYLLTPPPSQSFQIIPHLESLHQSKILFLSYLKCSLYKTSSSRPNERGKYSAPPKNRGVPRSQQQIWGARERRHESEQAVHQNKGAAGLGVAVLEWWNIGRGPRDHILASSGETLQREKLVLRALSHASQKVVLFFIKILVFFSYVNIRFVSKHNFSPAQTSK